MIKRGLGILDMACLLEIGKNTVIKTQFLSVI